MLLPFFARKGIKHFAVGRRVYDSRIDEMIISARTGANFEYLHRTENPRAIIRRLINEGKAFGVLVDQDTSVDGVFAHFLGRPAYSPSGPLRIALRYDIPTFVMFTARQPDNTHRVIISDRLVFEKSGDSDADLVRAVTRANAILSDAILAYPEQWVWMHRRWRRKPGAVETNNNSPPERQRSEVRGQINTSSGNQSERDASRARG
jgi:KDO2-lipid IV(A) lauroyltransferase